MCFQRWSIAREYYLSTYASTFYGVFRHLTASGFSKISALKKLFKIKSKMNNNMKVTFKACTTAVLLFLLFFPQITRSEEHTSELQSRGHLVCRLLLEKKKDHP